MEILNSIKTFLKDQTGGQKTIGEALDDGKKALKFVKEHSKETVATIATIATIASVAPSFAQEKNEDQSIKPTTISKEYAETNESIKSIENNDLSNPILVEHLTRADIDSGTRLINWEQTKRSKEQVNKLFFLRIHSKTTGNDPWCPVEATDRVKFYIYDKPNPHPSLLQLITIGKSNLEYGANDAISTWPKAIDYGLENAKQLATWKLNLDEKTKEFEIECQLADKNLRKQNINIFAISYQDWVDNPFPVTDTTGVIDVTYRNIARDFPFTGKGLRANFDKDGKLIKKFKLPRINEYVFNNSGVVIGLQNMDTKEIIGTTLCRFAKLNGIDKPVYFNLNNLPENVFENISDKEIKIKKEAINYTGLQKMTFSLKEALDVKHIELEIYQNQNDKEYFENLGYIIHDDVKENIDKIEYDSKTKRIKLFFKNPINGNKNIVSYITHFKKDNLVGEGGFSYQIKNLIITNSKNNLVYLDGNNPQRYFYNQPVVDINPLDLNGDTWVDNLDLKFIMDSFGLKEGDSNYEKIYDICQEGYSKGRIDISDLVTMIKEMNRQDELMDYVKQQNPNYKPNPITMTEDKKVNDALVQRWCKNFLREEQVNNEKTTPLFSLIYKLGYEKWLNEQIEMFMSLGPEKFLNNQIVYMTNISVGGWFEKQIKNTHHTPTAV